jgi:hypothetical protein
MGFPNLNVLNTEYFDRGVIDKVSSKLSSSPKLIIISFTFYISKSEKLYVFSETSNSGGAKTSSAPTLTTALYSIIYRYPTQNVTVKCTSELQRKQVTYL